MCIRIWFANAKHRRSHHGIIFQIYLYILNSDYPYCTSFKIIEWKTHYHCTVYRFTVLELKQSNMWSLKRFQKRSLYLLWLLKSIIYNDFKTVNSQIDNLEHSVRQ